MGRPSRMLESLRTAIEQRVSREFASDIFEPSKPLTPEEELEARRSELRNGLTDIQRLFLFGKLSGLNDKDGACSRLFGERGREHQTENLEAARACGV
jgi:hypothetical protein